MRHTGLALVLASVALIRVVVADFPPIPPSPTLPPIPSGEMAPKNRRPAPGPAVRTNPPAFDNIEPERGVDDSQHALLRRASDAMTTAKLAPPDARIKHFDWLKNFNGPTEG